jgi:hypothetical protein
MREASAEIEEKLAWRLRVFQRFPDHPQMMKLKRFPHEFNIPKLRDSFMRQFVGEENICRSQFEFSNNSTKKRSNMLTIHSAVNRLDGESMKRRALSNIIKFVFPEIFHLRFISFFRNSNNQRLFSGDISQMQLASINDYRNSLYLQENKNRLDQRYNRLSG